MGIFAALLDALAFLAKEAWGFLGDAMESLIQSFVTGIGAKKGEPERLGRQLSPQTTGTGGGGQSAEWEIPPPVHQEEDNFEAWATKIEATEQWLATLESDPYALIPPLVRKSIEEAAKSWGFLAFVPELFTKFMAIFKVMSAATQGAAEIRKQKADAITQHTIPDILTLIQVAKRKPEFQPLAKRMAKRLGFAPATYDIVEETARAPVDPDSVRALYLRGFLGEPEDRGGDGSAEAARDRLLRIIGYGDEEIAELVKLYEWIPPVQDLIRFVVREVYQDDFHAENDLIDPPPKQFLDELALTGGTALRGKQYWRAHWNLPSVTQGFEMLHRGVIEQGDLRFLLRALDVMPSWRDKLQAISFRRLTRVDLRRMHDIGVLSREQVRRRYQDLGYTAADAELMTRFTEDYNLKRERRSGEKELLESYLKGILTIGGLQSGLSGLGFREEDVQFIISGAVLRKANDDLDVDTRVLKADFTSGRIDRATASVELAALGYLTEDADRLINLWEVSIREREKFPTQEQLERFRVNGQLTDVEYADELLTQGYTQGHVNLFLGRKLDGSPLG